MKSSLIVIASIIAIFLSSCSNEPQQRICDMPPLYLQGNEEVYIDTTVKWELREKKVLRWDSLCGSDSVPVKYYVKNGISTKRIEYTTQGKLANLDSIAAAQNCNVIGGGPVNPNNDGPAKALPRHGNEDNNGGGFWGLFHGLPEWVQAILSFIAGSLFLIIIALVVISLLGMLAGMWGLVKNSFWKRRSPTDPPAYRVGQPAPVQQPTQQQQPIAPVTTGNPQIQSTCIAGVAPGAIVIPPAGPNLDTETISITRKYYQQPAA